MRGIRLDRMLSLSLLGHLLKIGHQPGIPILMYHSVCNTTGARHPYFETNTSVATFERHLQFLHDQEYATAYLSDLLGVLQSGGTARKLVVITFDDAFRNFYTQAFPLLSRYGFKATVFVPSRLVGNQTSILGPEPLMTWDEIREVSRHGVAVGSHSESHSDLYRADLRTLEHEVKFSKTAIEDSIGRPVGSFAYPFAFPEHDKDFCRRYSSLLEESGYDHGVTTVIGRASRSHSRFILPRLPINSHDDLALLAAKLKGDYDWLHAPQCAYKALKARFRVSKHRSNQVSTEEVRAR